MFNDLIGRSYVFDDGHKLEVIQVKHRDQDQVLVTCVASYHNTIPKKMVKTGKEFIDEFGHLFGLKNIDKATRIL